MPEFQLSRNAFGRLVFTGADGVSYSGVVPVRTFPIAAPDEGLSIVDGEGHEVAWVDCLAALPDDQRDLLEEELASREFIPEINRIRSVSSFATPSTWQVDTHCGETAFVLKGEEDIRRLGHHTLLIADSHGIQFLIRDIQALDRHSRKLLDRFL